MYGTENELYRGGIWHHSLIEGNDSTTNKENNVPSPKEYIKLKRESKIKSVTSGDNSLKRFSSGSRMGSKISLTNKTNIITGTTCDTQKSNDPNSCSTGRDSVNDDYNNNNNDISTQSADLALTDSSSASKGKKLFKNSIKKINRLV